MKTTMILSMFFMAAVCLSELNAGTFIEEQGSFKVGTKPESQKTPDIYHLKKADLNYILKPKHQLPISNVDVYTLTFPSLITTPFPENNTVYAEYYVPRNLKSFPATVVLDITGGDQSLSRTISSYLASRGVGCLFVQMAYYGPRRPVGSKVRLLSPDINHTLKAIQQTVLDIRTAIAWLEQRNDIDKTRIGITGTSLGSMIGALSAEMEPLVTKVVVLLGGGGLIEGYYDHPQALIVRKTFELFGGTKKQLVDLLAPVDPLTHAENLKTKQLLQIAGKNDVIVPPIMAKALWEKSGKQQIQWYDCGHYTAAFYFFDALNLIANHLKK
ncbi:MAG: abhydrolase domain-containing 18 [Planctomycetes bacterium]|nr:abhydrolase domain-containing 18 [Planctomycetota bacterium]NBY03451.1 abhydrolase domain-containing 18 [Planctomycetota bacterium]